MKAQRDEPKKEDVMIKQNCRYEATLSDGVLTVCLLGEIDHHSAVKLRTAMDEEILRQKPRKTVLDLSGIDFMDSSGLGLIMGRFSLMQKLGGTLTLKNPNERIVKILSLANMGRVIRMENDAKRTSRNESGEEESK
jgi:stage II sporulation protein AA (anti-sigma F factor antagonist)